MSRPENDHFTAWEDAYRTSQAEAPIIEEPSGWTVTACSIVAGLLAVWFLVA